MHVLQSVLLLFALFEGFCEENSWLLSSDSSLKITIFFALSTSLFLGNQVRLRFNFPIFFLRKMRVHESRVSSTQCFYYFFFFFFLCTCAHASIHLRGVCAFSNSHCSGFFFSCHIFGRVPHKKNFFFCRSVVLRKCFSIVFIFQGFVSDPPLPPLHPGVHAFIIF